MVEESWIKTGKLLTRVALISGHGSSGHALSRKELFLCLSPYQAPEFPMVGRIMASKDDNVLILELVSMLGYMAEEN